MCLLAAGYSNTHVRHNVHQSRLNGCPKRPIEMNQTGGFHFISGATEPGNQGVK